MPNNIANTSDGCVNFVNYEFLLVPGGGSNPHEVALGGF